MYVFRVSPACFLKCSPIRFIEKTRSGLHCIVGEMHGIPVDCMDLEHVLLVKIKVYHSYNYTLWLSAITDVHISLCCKYSSPWRSEDSKGSETGECVSGLNETHVMKHL